MHDRPGQGLCFFCGWVKEIPAGGRVLLWWSGVRGGVKILSSVQKMDEDFSVIGSKERKGQLH